MQRFASIHCGQLTCCAILLQQFEKNHTIGYKSNGGKLKIRKAPSASHIEAVISMRCNIDAKFMQREIKNYRHTGLCDLPSDMLGIEMYKFSTAAGCAVLFDNASYKVKKEEH